MDEIIVITIPPHRESCRTSRGISLAFRAGLLEGPLPQAPADPHVLLHRGRGEH